MPPNTMPASRQQQLQHLLALSAGMLDKAQSADWASVLTMELERQQRLKDFFAVAAAPAESAAIAAVLEQMQTLNAGVMALGAQSRQHVAAELSGLETGRKVAQAYNQNR